MNKFRATRGPGICSNHHLPHLPQTQHIPHPYHHLKYTETFSQSRLDHVFNRLRVQHRLGIRQRLGSEMLAPPVHHHNLTGDIRSRVTEQENGGVFDVVDGAYSSEGEAVAGRRIRIRVRIRGRGRVRVRVRDGARLGSKPFDAFGSADCAGGYDVRADAVGAFFYCEHRGQGVHGGFGGGDVCLVGCAWVMDIGDELQDKNVMYWRMK